MGSADGSLTEEPGLRRIVDEIVQKVAGGQKIIRDRRGGIFIRMHPERGSVYNEGVVFTDLRDHFVIPQDPFARRIPADEKVRNTHLTEDIRHGFGTSSGSQDEGTAVGREVGRSLESFRIGVVSDKLPFPPGPGNEDGVDGTYLSRDWIKVMEKRNDGLFIRDGHIHPAKPGCTF